MASSVGLYAAYLREPLLEKETAPASPPSRLLLCLNSILCPFCFLLSFCSTLCLASAKSSSWRCWSIIAVSVCVGLMIGVGVLLGILFGGIVAESYPAPGKLRSHAFSSFPLLHFDFSTVDCVVVWGDWSSCWVPVVSTIGNQTRTGKIRQPAAHGGIPCPPLLQTQECGGGVLHHHRGPTQTQFSVVPVDAVKSAVTIAGGNAGFADGFGTASRFLHPSSVGVDYHGSIIVADTDNFRIRKISRSGVH